MYKYNTDVFQIFVLNYTFKPVNNVAGFWYFFLQKFTLNTNIQGNFDQLIFKSRLNFKILSTISTQVF